MLPLRIAAVSHGAVPFWNAGSEMVLHLMLRALHRRGHYTKVFTPPHFGATSCWVHQGVEGASWRTLEEALDSMERWEPDLVITQHTASWDTMKRAKSMGIPGIFVAHMEGEMSAGIMEMEPDAVVVTRKEYQKRFDSYGARTFRMAPPCDPVDHTTTPGTAVTLANLTVNKGSDIFYELAARFPGQEFIGVIGAYTRSDIDVRPMPNVTVHESVSDMREIWSKTRVLLAPSVWETYSVVTVEACASGIPVLASDIVGMRIPLEDAAIFLPLDTPDVWEVQLGMLLTDQEYWNSRSAAARRRADRQASTTAADLERWVHFIETF